MNRVNTTFQITRGREIACVWVFYYYFLISYPISQKRCINWKKNTHLEPGVAIFATLKRFERLNNSQKRMFSKQSNNLNNSVIAFLFHSNQKIL